MKFLNDYYAKVGNPDILKLVDCFDVKVDWVVEAGCHDGTDTILMDRYLAPYKYFAFEPDPLSYARAKLLLETDFSNVLLFPFGLSDVDSELFFSFPHGEQGTGSTILASEGDVPVSVKRFDDVVRDLSLGGLLWLDVEGHAVKVLKGACEMLPKLLFAKIEVQMHDMSKYRKKDIFEVCKLMKKAKMLPLYAPIHPGYFGDVVFVRTNLLSRAQVGYSKFLYLQMFALHRWVYPILGKPK